MTVNQIVEQLICILEHRSGWREPSNRNDLFRLFVNSPRDGSGLPLVYGDHLKELVGFRLDRFTERFKRIEPSLSQVCEVWDEWRFVVVRLGLNTSQQEQAEMAIPGGTSTEWAS